MLHYRMVIYTEVKNQSVLMKTIFVHETVLFFLSIRVGAQSKTGGEVSRDSLKVFQQPELRDDIIKIKGNHESHFIDQEPN